MSCPLPIIWLLLRDLRPLGWPRHCYGMGRPNFLPLLPCVQVYLGYDELSVAVEMLSAVAVLNEVLDTKDQQAVIEQLSDLPLGFSKLDHDNLQR